MCGPLSFVVLSLIIQASARKEFVDLSHQHKPGIVVYPIYPGLNFTIDRRGFSEEFGVWLESNTIQTVEHYGTHVDVPSHMAQGKRRLHEVPVSQFIGPAVVIDITARAAADPDAMVMVADIEAWEAKYGQIPDGAIVLMKSGWDKKFSNEALYFGTKTPKDPSTFHYPGFHGNTTKWLVENRPYFHGIGVDSISLDSALTKTFSAHLNLFAGNKVGFENLANLEKIPEAGAMFYGVPMNLYDGSGCPIRAYATVDLISNTSSRPTPLAFWGILTVGLQALFPRFL